MAQAIRDRRVDLDPLDEDAGREDLQAEGPPFWLMVRSATLAPEPSRAEAGRGAGC